MTNNFYVGLSKKDGKLLFSSFGWFDNFEKWLVDENKSRAVKVIGVSVTEFDRVRKMHEAADYATVYPYGKKP